MKVSAKDQSEQLRREMIDSAGILVLTANADGRVHSLNHEMEAVTGFSLEEMEEPSVWDLMAVDDEASVVHSLFENLDLIQFPCRFQCSLTRKLDSSQRVAWSVSLNTPGMGSSGLVFLGIPIPSTTIQNTPRVDKEQRFYDLLQSSRDAAFITTLEGTILEMNPAGCAMFGASLDEMIGSNAADLYANPDDRQTYRQQMLRVGCVHEYPVSLKRCDGTPMNCLLSSSNWEVDGKPAGYIGLIRDITDQQRAEDSIRESEELFRKLFELSPDAIVLIDPHDTQVSWPIIDCNEVACRISGYTRSEIIGQSIDILNERSGPLDERGEYLIRLRREGAFTGEVLHRRKDGTLFPIMYSTSLIMIGDRELVLGIDRDISEQQLAQELLAEREARFHMLTSFSPVGIYLTNDAGGCIYVNEAWCELTGLTVEEAKGPGWISAIYDEDRDQVASAWQRLIDQGDEFALEYRFTTPAGKIQWVSGQAKALQDHNGVVSGFMGVVADISERKLFESTLEASERQYRLLVENASDSVLTTDLQGCITYVNPSVETLTGYTASEILGMPNADLAAPESRSALAGLFQKQMAEDLLEKDLEYPIITRAGERRWVQQRAALIKSGGEISGLQSIVRDITERKRAEESEQQRLALAEALHKTAEAISSTLDLNEVLDLILISVRTVVPHDMVNLMLIEDGTMVSIVRHRGYTDWGVETRITDVRFSLDDVPSFRAMIETQRPVIVSDTQNHPDWHFVPGTEWIQSYAGAPIRVEGEIIGFLNLDSMMKDTFKPDHAASLQAFADQAGVAIKNAELFADLAARNQELNAFSHTVAHDLKAPLQIVIGYASLLQSQIAKEGMEEAAELSRTISQFAFKMGEIIDSLLLLAEVRGKEIELSPVNMRVLAESAAMRFQDRIRDRGIALVLDDEFPPAVTYAPWIEEVLANLIGNAVKYIGRENADPRIEVHGRHEGDVLLYEVVDNGLGILEADQKRLFQPFARFHKGEDEGQGLGLTIAQRILRKLKGEIGVTSQPGERTVFWFTLPASSVE